MSTTKRESLGSSKHKDFYINAHGLRPTTNHESFDMAMLINSFQIKTITPTIIWRFSWKAIE